MDTSWPDIAATLKTGSGKINKQRVLIDRFSFNRQISSCKLVHFKHIVLFKTLTLHSISVFMFCRLTILPAILPRLVHKWYKCLSAIVDLLKVLGLLEVLGSLELSGLL